MGEGYRDADGGRDCWGVWDGHVHTVIFKVDNQQGLQYETGKSARCYVAAWMGREFSREWLHVYVWPSPFGVCLKLSRRC